MNESAPSKLQDVEVCSICMDRKQNAHISPCQHKFCSRCIVRWSKKQSSCPICRQQFTQILTSRKRIEVKPIVNPSPRNIRRNPIHMSTNMIFIPMPIFNYPWSYMPYMMSPNFSLQNSSISSFLYIPANSFSQNLQIN